MMGKNYTTVAFEDMTEPVPRRGKAGRDIDPALIDALTDSATRGVGKRIVSDEMTVKRLYKDLESCKRRLGWPVTISRKKVGDGKAELWFEASGFPESAE
jgi:hypothetical protein